MEEPNHLALSPAAPAAGKRSRGCEDVYSEQVLDHFKSPRNAGELADATAQVEVTNPVCGDVLRLAARLENGVVAAVRFKVSGCVPAIACGSMLTELMQARRVEQLAAITDAQVAEALGGLPPASRHAAQLAADALRTLLARFGGVKKQ